MKQMTYAWNLFLSTITFLLGGIDSLVLTLILVIVIDYLTGLLKAIYQKNLNSRASIKGIIKKCGYLFIVTLSVLLDRLLGDSSMAVRTLVLYFFIANEALSVLENWGSMDLPLPKKLCEVFEKLKNN